MNVIDDQTIVEVHTVNSVENEPAETNFSFDLWANTCGVSRKTSKLLRDQDLTTPETLMEMSQAELLSVGLTYGQTKTIIKALDTLRMPNGLNVVPGDAACVHQANREQGQERQQQLQQLVPDPQVQPPTHVTIRDVPGRNNDKHHRDSGKICDELFVTSHYPNEHNDAIIDDRNNIAGNVGVSCGANGQSVTAEKWKANDPRSVLTIKATKRKACHITQFLSEQAKERRQQHRRDLLLSTTEDGEERLVLQTNSKHPYAGITLDEWGAANMRIMHHLLQHGDLRREDVEFYMAYTTSMFELVHVYNMASILDMDYQYREQQAQLNFQWGEMSPIHQMHVLVPCERQAKAPQTENRPRYNRQQNNDKHEECRLFKTNNGLCPFGSNCR